MAAITLYFLVVALFLSLMEGKFAFGFSLSSTASSSSSSRRSFLAGVPTVIIAAPTTAVALDMDAFMNSQLAVDTKTTELSEDEALCRFGQPSPKTGEACRRAGLSAKRPGGVDAFGTIDRGSFVKCKAVYEREDPTQKGMLMKEWRCQ